MNDLQAQIRIARQAIEERLNSAIRGFLERPMSIGELGLHLFGRVPEINLASTAVGMCLAVIEYLLGQGIIREVEPRDAVTPIRYVAC